MAIHRKRICQESRKSRRTRATLPSVASVEKRQYQSGPRWVVRYRVGGQSRSKTFKTAKAAKDFATSVSHDVMTGTAVDPALGRVTLADFWIQWIEGQDFRPTTRSTYDQTLRYLGALGDRPLAAIRPMDIERWIAGLDLADSTKRLAYVRAKTVLQGAVVNGYLARNPAALAKGPRRPPAEASMSLSDEDVRAIVAKQTRNAEATLLGAVTGMRVGEIAGLRVRDVDVDNRLIHVEVQRGGAPLKTASSRRTVPVGQGVIKALLPLMEKKRPDDHLFNSSKDLSKSFRTAAKAAGVEATFHDLRAYAASRWIRAGLSVIEVQRLLGHGSATTTLATYARQWADQSARQREATEGIGEVLGYGLETFR